MLMLLKRFCMLALLSAFMLQLFFAVRIALANFIPITSTAFERTAAMRLLASGELGKWRHAWRSYDTIADNLKRAVIASEDSGFQNHYGVEWESVWRAWQHNQRVAAQHGRSRGTIRGGSTITQQLAKNLFLSEEQSYARKAQELLITFMLEAILSKERLLEHYLNHAQWGEGIYGAQAAAQHYYNQSAKELSAYQAAQLAAMLPRPSYYETHRNATYLQQRAARIVNDIPVVSVP